MKTLLDFYAPWCGPCKSLSKVIEEVEHELGVDIKKIDIDQNPDLVTKYKIRGVPTLILVDGDEVLATKVGAVNAAQLKAFVGQ